MTVTPLTTTTSSNTNTTTTFHNSNLGEAFDELRDVIHKVKFPEKPPRKMKEKKLKITIMTADGKKVTQVKREGEAVAPLQLKLAGKTEKGDVYVREDGKIVRLVKKKDKKKKKKEEKKRFKREMKRIRKEAESKARQQEEEEATQEAVELTEEEQIVFKESWQGDRVTKTTKVKRSHFDSARSLFVIENNENLSEELQAQLDEEDASDDDNSIEEPTADPLDKTFNSSTYTFQSVSSAEELDMLTDPLCDTLPSVQLQEDVEDALHEQELEQEDSDQALSLFCISLEDKIGKTYVQRMSEKSVEQLRVADRMRRQSDYHRQLGDVKEARLRAVNLPKHPTQSSAYQRTMAA